MTMAGIGHNMPPGYIPERRWIRVHQDWENHPLVGRGLMVRPRQGWPKGNERGPKVRTYNKGEAFEDLMFLARWKAGYDTVGGSEEYLEVGQLFGAVAWLAKRWNWTDKTVGLWLFHLEREGLIVREAKRATATAKAKGNGNGKGIEEERAKGKGKGKANVTSFAPSVITICNYSIIQGLEDQITVYCLEQKGQREGQGDQIEKGNGKGEGEGQRKGQELHTDIQTEDLGCSRARARERDPDPFGLNPYRKSESVHRSEDGKLTLSSARRSEWLAKFEDDDDLDLALIQIADKIQINSTKTVEVQVEAQLAGIIQRRRDQDRRYLKGKEDNLAARRPGGSQRPMSLDEIIELERKAKAERGPQS